MIEVMSAVFAAGETKTFTIPAEYFEVLDAAYPFDVMLMQRDGTQLSIIRGAEASYFTRPGRFETFTMFSANAQTIRWFLGSGDAGTRKLSGVVSVIDGGKARSLAGAAFSAYVVGGAVAGQYPLVQLWNPVGSGKNAVLEQILILSTTGPWNGGMYVYNAPLGVAGPAPMSKKAGGAAGASLTRTDNTAAPGVGVGQLGSVAGTSSVSATYKLSEPIILPPGFGLTVVGSLGQNVAATYEFFEEAI